MADIIKRINWAAVGIALTLLMSTGNAIWAVSAYASKATVESQIDRAVVDGIKTQIAMNVNANVAQDLKLAVVERDIKFILDGIVEIKASLARASERR